MNRAWGKAYVETSAEVLELVDSVDPVRDTRLLAQVINGMVLEQLNTPRPHFRRTVLEPTLQRLLTVIASGDDASRNGFLEQCAQ